MLDGVGGDVDGGSSDTDLDLARLGGLSDGDRHGENTVCVVSGKTLSVELLSELERLVDVAIAAATRDNASALGERCVVAVRLKAKVAAIDGEVDVVGVDAGDVDKERDALFGANDVVVEARCSLESSGGISVVCLLYTSPSPRDGLLSRMPSSA